MLAVREFSNASDLRAHYRDLRARMHALRPPPAPPVLRLPSVPAIVPPSPPPPAPLLPSSMIRRIIAAAARELGTDRAEASSPSRKRAAVILRQVVVLLAREFTTMSTPRIGQALGDRDHTTVLHASESILRKMAADPVLAGKVERLRAAVKGMRPMRYGKIDVTAQRVSVIDHGSFESAKAACGLGKVDFGVLAHEPGVGGTQIVVDEFGMFEPAGLQRYFAIGPRLYAGNALVFACDNAGNTVDVRDDLPALLPVRFYDTAGRVERAIRRGEIERPHMSIGSEVFWEWPNPRPNLGAAGVKP